MGILNDPPMKPEDKVQLAAELRERLASHRTTFVVDKMMFEWLHEIEGRETNGTQKVVTAAALKLLLDYCENDWGMGFVSYCAAIFHSREPAEGECAFDLLPDVKDRLSADRIGLGHIYGGGNT